MTEEEFDNFYSNLDVTTSCLYRGVNESKYKIYTSLQRAYIEGSVPNGLKSSEFVAQEINNLKITHNGVLEKFYQATNIMDTDFVYLSFLQHHRAPTPFLDFTRNIDVALFFAMSDVYYDISSSDDISSYASLYVIKLGRKGVKNITDFYKEAYQRVWKMLRENTKHVPIDMSNIYFEKLFAWKSDVQGFNGLHNLKLGLVEECNISKHRFIYDRRYLNNALDNLSKKLTKGEVSKRYIDDLERDFNRAIEQNSKLTNLNIIAQEGRFLLYNLELDEVKNRTFSLEDYWRECSYSPDLTCINIHKSLSTHIMKRLQEKNITQATIYPNMVNMAREAYLGVRK
ncbi:MAG: FRG domain-containing protein [Lachnospira sp.]